MKKKGVDFLNSRSPSISSDFASLNENLPLKDTKVSSHTPSFLFDTSSNRFENRPSAFEVLPRFDKFKKSYNKKGQILIENVIFIILNLVFLSILILFLTKQASGESVLEESYSKKIALLADYSKPEMIIKFDMKKGMKISDDNGFDFSKTVRIDNDKNLIYVKLRENGGYSYTFFNEVNLNAYPDIENNEYTGLYVLTVTEEVFDEN